MAQARILVVDDDPKFLHFVTELLIGAGYNAVGTADPGGARDLAATIKPDLIILDIAMPRKDGFALARELLAVAVLKLARVMFLTAHKAGTHVKSAKAAGGVAYLEKPVRSSSLLWMVKALLSGGPGRRVKAL